MIEINNLTSFAVDKRFFIRVAKKVLKGENREIENISIAFVSPAEIKKLNQKYRKKSTATDVLSFSRTLSSKSDLSEIVICPEVVKKNGDELAKILIHGILHTLGYDHEKSKAEEKRMNEKQDYYLSII